MLMPPRLHLTVLPGELAVVRLPPDEPPPPVRPGALFSVTATTDEISVVCPAGEVPDGASAVAGWRAIKVQGPVDVDTVGVLASMLEPLARTQVSVFTLSTYETDYVLVHEDMLRTALATLKIAGHDVRGEVTRGDGG
jgi:hypothetical protein